MPHMVTRWNVWCRAVGVDGVETGWTGAVDAGSQCGIGYGQVFVTFRKNSLTNNSLHSYVVKNDALETSPYDTSLS